MIFAALNCPLDAAACDIPFPPKGSTVSWPEGLFAAKVETLRAREVSEGEWYAWVRVIEPLAGKLPHEFGVIYSESSCGANFKARETQVTGFTALPPEERKGDYHYSSNSIAATLANGVFVSRWLKLRR